MSTRIDITAVGAGPDRYVLRRDSLNGPPRWVRVWYHGGGQGPGGSSRQEGRIPPEAGCVDYFGEGTPHPDQKGGVTTGWIRPDGPDPGAGLTTQTDVVYTRALLDLIRSAHPGLPIYVAGYSSGGAFWTSCIHNSSLDLSSVHGWAVVKNTPVFPWLSNEPAIVNRSLVVAGVLPMKFVCWYATGDTEASQEHSEGHTTFEEAVQVFYNTYRSEPIRLMSYSCGKRRTRIDTEQGAKFMSCVEHGGSHSSSWGCVGYLIHRHFIGGL